MITPNSAQIPVHRPCPVCNAPHAEPYGVKADLTLVRCQNCDMIFASPVAHEYRSGQYYEQAGKSFYLSAAKLAGDYAAVRFERELRVLRRWCPRGNILDVGCSSGGFLFQLRKRFPDAYQVLGTDVSGPALDYAESQGVPVVRGDFLNQNFRGRLFDMVTFWAVLEHVADPAAFLERACSVLKPGGYCAVLVPNMRSLAVRLLGLKYRYVYKQHLNYWTDRTLKQSLQPFFTLEELRTTHFNPLVIWQDWRGGGQEVSNQERAQLLQRTTVLKQKAWLAPVKGAYSAIEGLLGLLGIADNLVAIGRKCS